MATAEQIAVGSAAAVMSGDDPISDFAGSAAGDVLNNLYEQIVRGELGERKYKWAQKLQQLSREVAVPEALWDSSYVKPSDVIEMLGVFNGSTDEAIAYEVFEQHIFCNAVTDDVVVGKYVYRVDEAYWPYQFRLGMIMALAGYLALSVQEDAEKADMLWTKAEMRFRRAGQHSMISSTSQKIRRRGRLLQAFGGSR